MKKEPGWRKALRAARPLLANTLHIEITSYGDVEAKPRKGAIENYGSFYHIDTINDVDALRSVRAHQRALRLIDAALR